ncbi:hypothetical protein, partial [Inquilinus limosus]|uniref:hypothetical protein n=1 Tax=Inquilinus limosus TaxID=171674 RepID=UPI001EE6DF94
MPPGAWTRKRPSSGVVMVTDARCSTPLATAPMALVTPACSGTTLSVPRRRAIVRVVGRGRGADADQGQAEGQGRAQQGRGRSVA